MMLISDIIEKSDIVETIGNTNIHIDKISYDSRRVSKNAVFVCINGFKSNGNDYINDAILKGATIIITEEKPQNIDVPVIIVKNARKTLAQISANFYNNPSNEFGLIGVTGTNGKTTTTYLIKSILESSGYKVGLIGTNQNMISDKTLPTERTTPESLELQMLFREMADEKVDYVVMEVSSHSLELNRVDYSNFEVGIFTNLTQDQL